MIRRKGKEWKKKQGAKTHAHVEEFSSVILYCK